MKQIPQEKPDDLNEYQALIAKFLKNPELLDELRRRLDSPIVDWPADSSTTEEPL